MAVKRKKNNSKRFLYRFELGLGGMAAIGVVCFCIFLWMFLLGIWAGQTVLQGDDDLIMKSPRLTGKKPMLHPSQPQEIAEDIDEVELVADELAKAEEEAEREKDASFFTLQIAAYHDPAGAKRMVETWQSRGYNAFLRPPEREDDKFTRVYVGKFENLADANAKAVELEKEENLQSFIALLTTARNGKP